MPSEPETQPGPRAGDRVPDLRLADDSGAVLSLYDRSRGAPVVLTLTPTLDTAPARAHLDTLDALMAPGEPPRAHCFVVSRDRAALAQARARGGFAGHLLIDDGAEDAAGALGLAWPALEGRARTLVLDPNQRVLRIFDGEPEATAREARAFVAGLRLYEAPERPRDIAPVLLIPRVFEPEFCRDLIEAFHTRGHEPGGTYSLVEGEAGHSVDRDFKRRLDHYVRDDDLMQALTRRVGARIVPEIDKAFWYRVTRAEEYKITCYRGSDQGRFRPHRDNLSPQTAHRRFAVTINLNDDFEGGELVFREYGDHLYRPRVGEAIVFSCSLLHEALPVTDGDRYVLVAFLYGEDGVQQKRAIEAQRHPGAA